MADQRWIALAYPDGTTLTGPVPTTALSAAKYARETKLAYDADEATSGFKWGLADTEEEAITSAESKLS